MKTPTVVEKLSSLRWVEVDGRPVRSWVEQSRFGPFLLRHWKIILKSAAVTTLIALLYLLASAPVYTAQTQILIDPGLPNVLRDQTIEPPMAMDSQQVETEIAVLRSEEVALAVIDRLKLQDSTQFKATSLSDYLPSWLTSDDTRLGVEREKARALVANFQKNMTVRRIGVSYAIDVYYTSTNAEQAALIANAIAEEYIRFQTETRSNAAKLGSQWLESRLADLRAEMNQASRKMQEHRARRDYSIGGSARLVPPAAQAATPSDSTTPAQPAPEAVTEEDLESTANTYRRIYENYLQSYMGTLQRQSFPISNARVITKAARPLNPTRPAGLILSMAFLFGAALGAAIGHVGDRLKVRVPAARAGETTR